MADRSAFSSSSSSADEKETPSSSKVKVWAPIILFYRFVLHYLLGEIRRLEIPTVITTGFTDGEVRAIGVVQDKHIEELNNLKDCMAGLINPVRHIPLAAGENYTLGQEAKQATRLLMQREQLTVKKDNTVDVIFTNYRRIRGTIMYDPYGYMNISTLQRKDAYFLMRKGLLGGKNEKATVFAETFYTKIYKDESKGATLRNFNKTWKVWNEEHRPCDYFDHGILGQFGNYPTTVLCYLEPGMEPDDYFVCPGYLPVFDQTCMVCTEYAPNLCGLDCTDGSNHFACGARYCAISCEKVKPELHHSLCPRYYFLSS